MHRFLRLAIIPLSFLGFINQARAQLTVVSAASYQPLVAPNSLATIFGSGLATSVASAELDSSGQLPTELKGVSVSLNGTAAGLLYVSPGQINFLVPATIDIGTAIVAVESSGINQSSGSVQVRNVAPALFALDASGRGAGAIQNGVTFSGGPFLVETPQNPGSDKRTRLSVFATGLRYAGNPAHDPALPNAAIQVQAQDSRGNIYDVEYAGAAPGFFGLDQINLIVPAQADGAGSLTLTVVAEGRASNTVTFTVGSIPAASIHLASLTLSQPFVIGGNDLTGTVSLNGVARSNGYTVNLATSSLLAQIPLTVTVPAGSSLATFTAHTSTTGNSNDVTLTASASGLSQASKFTVFPANSFQLTGVTLSTGSIKGGVALTGTLSLSGNPPLGGSTVVLNSDNKGVVVPGTVNLGFGQTSATFPIATTAVSNPQTAKITATYSQSTASATLSIKPVLTLALASSGVTGGAAVTGTITLFDTAPAAGATATLQSTNSTLANVPVSLQIPAGKSSGTFTVLTTAVTASTTVAIAASYGGVTTPVLLTINPPNLPSPLSLMLSSFSITGGISGAGTLTLSAPAPAGGLSVDISSDDPLTVQAPAFVTVPSGQTSATFAFGTVKVTSPRAVTISASLGGISKSANLTVQ